MTIATPEGPNREWLGALEDETEIIDDAGKSIGVFFPNLSAEEALAYEQAKKMIDPAEIERRIKEESGTGVALAEIWKRLGVKVDE